MYHDLTLIPVISDCDNSKILSFVRSSSCSNTATVGYRSCCSRWLCSSMI